MAVGLAVVGSGGAARAEGSESETPGTGTGTGTGETERARTRPHALRYDLTLDVAVTLGIATVALTSVLAEERLMPDACRVCDEGAVGGGKGGLDGAMRDLFARRDPQPARVASDVTAFGVAPVLALGLGTVAAVADRRGREAPLDALLVAEATSAAMVVDGALGLTLAREKPWRASLDAETRETLTRDPGALGSMPSSHVTLAFAMAASAGTVASLRGYRLAPLVWGASATAAALTAYLRMAGDEAWATDTLVGAGLGTLIGAGVPLLFHGRRPERTTWLSGAVRPYATAIPGGRVVGLGGAF